MSSRVFLRGTSLLLAAGALTACALTACAPGDPPANTPPPSGGDMAVAQPSPSPSPSPSAQPSPSPSPSPSPASMLPFVIDNAFVTSGFMGDGATAGTITMVPSKPGDSTDCDGMRSSNAATGSCHSVTYAAPASGGQGWGGVYWQFPANNWGTKAGYSIPAGATKVTFKARGSKGGEKVTFVAGGIITPGNPFTDSLKAQTTVTLTADWADYSIDLGGQTYSQVIGAFAWTMAAADAAAASGRFFVDDIKWQ